MKKIVVLMITVLVVGCAGQSGKPIVAAPDGFVDFCKRAPSDPICGGVK